MTPILSMQRSISHGAPSWTTCSVLSPGFVDGNIGGFAQAADDTRAVINYMHSWPLPAAYATEPICVTSATVGYDVSISPESGLQVPMQMVDGTEGREFIVTVARANAGYGDAVGTVYGDRRYRRMERNDRRFPLGLSIHSCCGRKS